MNQTNQPMFTSQQSGGKGVGWIAGAVSGASVLVTSIALGGPWWVTGIGALAAVACGIAAKIVRDQA